MTIAAMQRTFADALLDPAVGAPHFLQPKPERAFDIYRNNVAVTLIDALAARFPVTVRLVGEAFFRAMARCYSVANLPDSPVLSRYGNSFPDFITRFAPASGLPYLADVARLEMLLNEAYHAADAVPLQAGSLAAMRPADLAQARVILHPAARLMRPVFPVATIWAAHQPGGIACSTPPGSTAPGNNDLMVLRPYLDTVVLPLSRGAGDFISALCDDATVGEAAASVLCSPLAGEGFDVGRTLIGLTRAGTFAAIA